MERTSHLLAGLAGSNLLAGLADLVLPRACVGCAAAGEVWCGACLPDGELLAPHVLSDLPVRAAAAYDGAVRAALLRYKERSRRDLAPPLAVLLARSLAAAPRPGGPIRVLVVPVPSAAAAVRARGGNPLDRLARVAAGRAGLRVATGALHVARAVRDSAGLHQAERAANLAGAFVARPAPPATAAVLVDDIVTTGSTLRESTRALRAAGWPVLGAAVVAATPATRTTGPRSAHWQGTPDRSSVMTT